jgi:hypothetical protein
MFTMERTIYQWIKKPTSSGILWKEEFLHQLIDGKPPIIYRVSTIRLVVQENHPRYGGFHKCGFPQNGWFIMENP